MTDISRRFEQIVNDYYRKHKVILPVKTTEGILVGDILIRSHGSFKNIEKNGEIKYPNIFLNEVAVKIANLMSQRLSLQSCDQLYQADQDYGKWLVEWQNFKTKLQRSDPAKDSDRYEILSLKCAESKLRTEIAKKRVTSLIGSK